DRHHGQRRRAEVLGEEEVLEVPDAVRLVVAPEVPVGRALLDRADRLLPLVRAATVGEARLLVRAERADVRHATAGEAQELRVERVDLLREVLAEHGLPVDRADPGVLREERDLVESERARRAGEEREAPGVRRAGRGERDVVLLPRDR